MKSPKLIVIAFVCSIALLFIGGCKSSLQPGGAYAPANITVATNADGTLSTNVTATVQADPVLFRLDSSYDFYMTLANTVFNAERDNRALLEKISPSIKHTLDGIRPAAKQAAVDYAKARVAYLQNRIPANETVLEAALSKAAQVQAAVQAVQGDIGAALAKGN